MPKKAEPGIPFYQMKSGHIMNTKVRLLYAELGSDAYWIWNCILADAYGKNGYFFNAGDQDHLLIFSMDTCKKPMDLVYGVIKLCVKRDLFDKGMYEKFKILTSERMQRMYLWATKDIRRKGTEIEMIREYSLLGENITNEATNLHLVNIISGKIETTSGNGSGNSGHNKIKENKIEENTVVSPSAPPKNGVNKNPQSEEVEPYWTDLVDTYSKFVEKNFPGEKINWSYKSEDKRKSTRDPKLFKELIHKLKHRAETKKKEWTKEYACSSLLFYLEKAHEDDWFKKHWLLKNLVEHFDAIFKRVATETKEKSDKAEKQKQFVENKSRGTHADIDNELSYLFGRYVEGELDASLIKPEHYDRLVVMNTIQVGSMNDHKGDTPEEKKVNAVLAYFKHAKKTVHQKAQ